MKIIFPKSATDKIKNRHNDALVELANSLKMKLEDFSKRKILHLEEFEDFDCACICVYARKKLSNNPVCELMFYARHKESGAEIEIRVKICAKEQLEIIFVLHNLKRDYDTYHFKECYTENGAHDRLGLPRFQREIEMKPKLKEIMQDLEDLFEIIY